MAEKPSLKPLFAPLYNHYLSRTNCDLALVSSDKVKFKVHSIVAAATFPAIRQNVYWTQKRRPGLLSCIGVAKPKKATCHLPKVKARELQTLVEFSYLGTCDFSRFACENLTDILLAAVDLEIADLVLQIEEYLECNLTTTVALKLFSLPKGEALKRVFSMAEAYLLRHLLEHTAEDLQVDLQSLLALLKDNRLHATREELVWEAIEKWAHVENEVEQLIKCLRIGLLPENYLQTVKNSPLVKFNSKALAHLNLAEKSIRAWMASSNSSEIETLYEVTLRIPHLTIVCVGGFQSEFSPIGQLEFYNMNAKSWSMKSDFEMNWPRGFCAAETIDNCLYVMGGIGVDEALKSCQKLDFMTAKWTDFAPMSQERSYFSSAVLNGEIYVAGGQGVRLRERIKSVEKFSPSENSWIQLPDMKCTRCDFALINFNGVLMALGGLDGHLVTPSVEKLDPAQKEWTLGPRMVRPRSGLAAVVLDGHVFAFGGFDGFLRLADGERLDPETNTWTLLTPMATPKSNFGLVLVDRLIYAVGGFGGDSSSGAPIADVEVYDPACDLWYRIESTSIPRSGLVCCAVDSLDVALKLWPQKKVADTEKVFAETLPPFESTSKRTSRKIFPVNNTETLSLPHLDQLPAEWMEKYTEESGVASSYQHVFPDFEPITVVLI